MGQIVHKPPDSIPIEDLERGEYYTLLDITNGVQAVNTYKKALVAQFEITTSKYKFKPQKTGAVVYVNEISIPVIINNKAIANREFVFRYSL